MDLIIKNLGAIEDVKIALDKRFYVFVGYNNSGKTHLSQILWSLFDNEIIRNFTDKQSYDELILADGKFELNENFLDKMLTDFANYIKVDVLPELFNISKDHFLIDNTEISFQYELNQILNKESKSSIMVNGQEFFHANKSPDSNIIEVSLHNEDNMDDIPDKIKTSFLNESNVLLNFILSICLGRHHEFYLPASRLFYPIFYQYIYKVEKEKREEMSKKLLSLLEQKNVAEFKLDSLVSFRSQYTKSMDELFSKLYHLKADSSIKDDYNYFIEQVKTLLGGDVIIKKTEGIAPIEFQLDLGDEKHLDMYLTSSSINQLTTLLLYFKYWVSEENNFLLVDEPEENLHPENQVKLTEILLKFASKNENRVLVTTHSPLITNVINNFINLGSLKEQENFNLSQFLQNNEIDFTEDEVLSQKDFGIYFFSGPKVVEYSAQEYGVYFEDFAKVQNRIKNMSEKITDEIYQLSE